MRRCDFPEQRLPVFRKRFPYAGAGHAMSVYWVVVALLLGGALLMVLPPLLRPTAIGRSMSVGDVNLAVYRDQLREAEGDLRANLLAPDQLSQARTDIQRRLQDDSPPVVTSVDPLPRPATRSAMLLALLIPAASVLTYMALGDPQSLRVVAASTSGAALDTRHGVNAQQIQDMVASLVGRMKSDPNYAEGWMMLGRSYTALGRYGDAVTALRRASALAPDNVSLLVDLADVLGMVQGKRLAGEPARLVQRALDIDPRHVKALALAGSVAFEMRDYTAARGYWDRVVDAVPPESDIARSMRGSIAQARQLEGAAASAALSTPVASPTPAGTSVTGQVAVNPELAARIAPGDTLFVFARAAQGPRMPLAIQKMQVGPWPAAFALDDMMAMAPNLKLSGYSLVVVSARISKSGNATPQPGDLVGQSVPLAPGTRNIQVVIDAVQP